MEMMRAVHSQGLRFSSIWLAHHSPLSNERGLFLVSFFFFSPRTFPSFHPLITFCFVTVFLYSLILWETWVQCLFTNYPHIFLTAVSPHFNPFTIVTVYRTHSCGITHLVLCTYHQHPPLRHFILQCWSEYPLYSSSPLSSTTSNPGSCHSTVRIYKFHHGRDLI